MYIFMGEKKQTLEVKLKYLNNDVEWQCSLTRYCMLNIQIYHDMMPLPFIA